MSDQPRIFISHSTHDKDHRDALRKVAELLGARGFEVLLDWQRLRGGDDWHEEIFHMLNLADSAFIFFTRDALKSDWVKTEAGILSWRATLSRGKQFRLIPVLFGGVTPSELTSKEFAPARAAALQGISSDDPAVIADRLAEQFDKLKRSETPLEQLERQLARLISEVGEADVKQAARAIGVDTDRWPFDEDFHRLLAGEMLRRGLWGAFPALRDNLDRFLKAEDRDRLIESLKPAWVNLSTAGLIPDIARPEGRRAFAVNGGTASVNADFTSVSFICRAFCRTPDNSRSLVVVSGTSGEDLVGHYRRTLRGQLKLIIFNDKDLSDEALRIRLLDRKEMGEPIFAVFLPPPPDGEVIKEVRRRAQAGAGLSAEDEDEFPAVTFFLLTGDDSPSSLGSLFADVEILEPAIGAGEELKAFSKYRAVKSVYP